MVRRGDIDYLDLNLVFADINTETGTEFVNCLPLYRKALKVITEKEFSPHDQVLRKLISRMTEKRFDIGRDYPLNANYLTVYIRFR